MSGFIDPQGRRRWAARMEWLALAGLVIDFLGEQLAGVSSGAAMVAVVLALAYANRLLTEELEERDDVGNS